MLFARFLFALAMVMQTLQTQSADDRMIEFDRRLAVGTPSVSPEKGFVPDASTAIAIATAVVVPIYGKAIVKEETPWRAGLKDGVWTVIGTFHGGGAGGEAIIQIDQKKGTILFVNHTA